MIIHDINDIIYNSLVVRTSYTFCTLIQKKNQFVYHFIALYSLESSVNVVWSAMTQYNINKCAGVRITVSKGAGDV